MPNRCIVKFSQRDQQVVCDSDYSLFGEQSTRLRASD